MFLAAYAAWFELIALVGEHDNTSRGLFSPLYSVFVEDIGGGLVAAGSAYSLFAIASSLMIELSNYWEDHFTHEAQLIAAGYALTAVDDAVLH